MAILDKYPASEQRRHVPSPDEECPPRPWKWTGDDLIRMGGLGLLPPEGRFELLDGVIYQLMPPGPFHSYLVGVISGIVERLVAAAGACVREEKPIRLNATYDPQPDVAVVRGPKQTYRDRYPEPHEVLLVIEVVLSSLDHDRDLKLPAYGAAGIPECWLVNVREKSVEVYRDPGPAGYRLRRICGAGETIELLASPAVSLRVDDLLDEKAPAAQ